MALRGNGVIVSFIVVSKEHEVELGEWYNRDHLDHRVNFERFKRARRYVSVDQPHVFMAFYESDAVEDFRSSGYLTMLHNETEWSMRMRKVFVSLDRLACRVKVDAMTGIGGAMSLARIFPHSKDTGSAQRWLGAQVFPQITAMPGITGACALENDPETANAPGNAYGRPLPAATEAEWAIAIEGADSTSTEAALRAMLDTEEFSSFFRQATVRHRTYNLLYANHR